MLGELQMELHARFLLEQRTRGREGELRVAERAMWLERFGLEGLLLRAF